MGAPVLTQGQYHDLRADRAAGHGGGLWQRCQSCGRCEYAGGYCSWCLAGDYVLLAHLHPRMGLARVCPLAAVSARTTPSLLGVYHHLPGASLRRFPVAMSEVSDARQASLIKAIASRRVAAGIIPKAA